MSAAAPTNFRSRCNARLANPVDVRGRGLLRFVVPAYLEAMSKLALKESPAMAMDPINDALLIYTGYGKSPFPRARGHDLVTEFGAEQGTELKARILALVEELQQPLAEGEKRSKKSVTERAIEQLAPKHPELDAVGLKALAWTYSFGLR
jgi:hypothetical protein